MAKKTQKKSANERVKKTREKIKGTPFKSARDMENRSKEIQHELWEQLTRAKHLHELFDRPEFDFVKSQLAAGLEYKFESDSEFFVKAWSEGKGVKVSINDSIAKKLENNPNTIEAIIRACSNSFSETLFGVLGLKPVTTSEHNSLLKTLGVKKG